MDYSFGLPGPGCYWCPPPSICASCAAWLPCNSARSAGRTLLSLLRFHCGTKGLALCGVSSPSTPLWNDFALLCSAALRYSSLMFQDPQGTFGKALEYPLWFLRAIPPPFRCCLLAPPPPSSVLGVPVSVFGPAPAALPPLPLPLRPYLLLDVCVSCSPSC